MPEKTGVASELRQDVVSGDWVVIATGRAKRPSDFVFGARATPPPVREACPFDLLHEKAAVTYARDGTTGTGGDDWFVQVVPNKYPAFAEGACPVFRERGPYRAIDGIGYHDVVVTREHDRPLARMAADEADLVLRAYQDRCRAIREDPCIRYISVFHNHGPQAGATVAHPHSQIIATPVVPPDIGRSVAGSQAYFAEYRACIHCAILAYELRVRERVVYENQDAVVFAPFASKTAFELRVMPKVHQAHFEVAEPGVRMHVAEALVTALGRLAQGLDRPDYNFFLHTAPIGGEGEAGHDHYHWHFEIIPKTAVWAGFEIGTGIEISTIAPEDAAAFLRDISV